MQLASISIENFRSIRSLKLSLDETTLLIGPNNGGKSAVLEAVRIGLSRRWGQRGTGFTEDDVHRPDDATDPRTAPPIKVQFVFRETEASEWPADMVAELDEIMTIAADGLNQISLAISYPWNSEKELFEPSWEFLNPDGSVLQLRRRSINTTGFFEYIAFQWLGALRDAEEEFTPRSRNWGGLLKAAKIPAALENEIKKTLDDLDAKILASDPRFGRIADTVGLATQIAIESTPGAAKLRMLPLDVWDLLTRANVVLRNEDVRPWLPLTHHGQGLQSLSVIFLLQAAVAQQLLEEEREGIQPNFAIEEPEAHLHPQAARTLWKRISELPGQKLATTHSPYFVQNVPLHNLRLLRLRDGLTEATFLSRRIVSDLPWTDEVQNLVIGKRLMLLSKDATTGAVASTATIPEDVGADLAKSYRTDPNAADLAARAARFRRDCRVLISEDEERELSFLGRRLRGEIFFARRWCLVEGQCEYLLVQAIGQALGYDLDQHGVTVIDFKNNGSAGIYAGLADAFGVPWHMMTDSDDEKVKFEAELIRRGFSSDDLKLHFDSLPAPNNLEDQLIADGHELLLRTILSEFIGAAANACTTDELKKHLRKRKIRVNQRTRSMVLSFEYQKPRNER
jgi:putative ATP-dependent endonuclease of OLD family